MFKEQLNALNLDTFISIDVESTGTDLSDDKIIELSACKYKDGKLLETYTSLINPQKKLTPFIINLTGIRDNDLNNRPIFSLIEDDFLAFIKHYPLVGHNIEFDINFLNKELNGKYDIYENRYICDTYHLAKIFFFYSESFKLSSLCQNFNISVDDYHRAEDDANSSAMLFLKMIDEIIKINVDILSKINRSLRSFNIFNKDLLENIIPYLLNQNKMNSHKNIYKNKIPGSVYHINKSKKQNSRIDIQHVFSKTGPLSKNINNYECRNNQIDFSIDCLKSIENSSILVAEAETGIGKSFSYLISSLVADNRKQIIISTSTHNLQNQLFQKDIPMISNALDLNNKTIIVKGMNNYLCKSRYENIMDDIESYITNDEIQDFISILFWAEITLTGDISECNSFRFKENLKIWNLIKYESEICQLNNFANHKNCFYQLMNKEIKDSNIVIVNHALLASSINKQNSFLCEESVCIVDEAHKLTENCREQLRDVINNSIFKSIFDSFISIYTKINHYKIDQIELKNQFNKLKHDFESFMKDFNDFMQELCYELIENKKNLNKNYRCDIRFDLREENNFMNTINPKFIIDSFNKISSDIECMRPNIIEGLNSVDKINYTILINKCQDVLLSFKKIFKSNDQINWMTIYFSNGNVSSTSINTTPFSIREFINDTVSKFSSMIFCSATLTVNGTFDYFTNELSLDNFSIDKQINYKNYPSNFYCNDQTKLFVLDSHNDINSFDHSKNLYDIIKKINENINKRMLVLCTSYHQIRVLEEIHNNFLNSKDNILFQNINTSRQIILNKYLEKEGSVLIGTNTFWEGIDLPADKLEILLITKLPFSNPSNPIVESKINYYNSIGKNAFTEYQLPKAILKLKQGVGRLIRSQDDMGVCILTDPRISKKKYGKIILDSLNLNPIEFANNDNLVIESKKFLGC